MSITVGVAAALTSCKVRPLTASVTVLLLRVNWMPLSVKTASCAVCTLLTEVESPVGPVTLIWLAAPVDSPCSDNTQRVLSCCTRVARTASFSPVLLFTQSRNCAGVVMLSASDGVYVLLPT